MGVENRLITHRVFIWFFLFLKF